MISCVAWVRKGIAKEIPDKVVASQDELREIIEAAKRDFSEFSIGQECAEEMETEAVAEEEEEKDAAIREMYMEGYDNDDDARNKDDEGEGRARGMEGDPRVLAMAELACFGSNEDDSYLTNKEEIDDEDLKITSGDNLIVAGRADGDMSTLDVYVYNNEEDSLYVHHMILLSSFPLAVEWMDFDPHPDTGKVNYVAVGTMEPEIGIWDLDVVESLEPMFTLGSKKSTSRKKPQKASGGHCDAVMALSWNPITRNVLASGSADKTIQLWDMARGDNTACIMQHKDKVQTLSWHPNDSNWLLSGSFDKTVQLFESNNPDANAKSWKFSGQIESVAWNHLSDNSFLASTDDGFVFGLDVRQAGPVFSFQAHDEAVTALCLSSGIPGCVITGSDDKTLKVWDIQDSLHGGDPTHVLTKKLKLGPIMTASFSPDVPFVVAVGGQKESLRVLNPSEFASVQNHFESRSQSCLLKRKEIPAAGVPDPSCVDLAASAKTRASGGTTPSGRGDDGEGGDANAAAESRHSKEARRRFSKLKDSRRKTKSKKNSRRK
eukprot:m.133304 g.133304  ORF g.133304 m.133304 type:complete len:547 (+) comp38122_c1_seq4:1135-2775(+)